MPQTRDILIVDDNTDNLRVLTGILKAHGYEARPVSNGPMALSAMDARPPALILMDIMMPGMDGFEVCTRIKAEARTRDIPLIFISALDRLEDKLKAFSAGAVDYITKPFHEAEVLARIKTHLTLVRARESLRESEALNRQLFKSEGLLRMSAAIAHKFNNHLHAVLGNLEMAKIHIRENPSAIQAIETAMDSVEKAARLSSLILTYTGKTKTQHTPMDLKRCCAIALSEIRTELPANIHMESHFPDIELPIQGDCQGIRQILKEMVLNAQEAMTGGGCLTLNLHTIPGSKIPGTQRFPLDFIPRPGFYACLEIQDTGCGIQPADLEKIFDPFFSTNFLGRGMGLSAVLGMVRSHGGAILVNSTPGKGSVFRICFPLIPQETASAQKALSSPSP